MEEQFPPWLSVLYETDFEALCVDCKKRRNSELCIDCKNLYCETCISAHDHHIHLKIYRASRIRKLGLDVLSMRKFMDTTDIKSYIANTRRIVYVKSKCRHSSDRPSNFDVVRCEMCGWELTKGARFCSIMCKHKKFAGDRFVMEDFQVNNKGKSDDVVSSNEDVVEEIEKSASCRKRSRKQKCPKRSPLF